MIKLFYIYTTVKPMKVNNRRDTAHARRSIPNVFRNGHLETLA